MSEEFTLRALEYGVNPVFDLGVKVVGVSKEDALKVIEVVSHTLFSLPDPVFKKIVEDFNIDSALVPNLMELALFLAAEINNYGIFVTLATPNWYTEHHINDLKTQLNVISKKILAKQRCLHKFSSINDNFNMDYQFHSVQFDYSCMFNEAVEKIRCIFNIIEKLNPNKVD